jgi:glucosamine-phosphate N-acetyltransferase
MPIKYAKLNEIIFENISNIDVIKDKYLNLLSELTKISNLDTNVFFTKILTLYKIGSTIIAYKSNPNCDDFVIIASGTIIIEPKIIRGGRNVGHIEDIVVKEDYRGKGICKYILDMLKNIAKENDCYKIILDCQEELKNVYIKSDFKESGIQMSIYL